MSKIIVSWLYIFCFAHIAFSQTLERYHPADTNVNGIIEESEFTAYNNAWRNDSFWSTHFGSVPKDYLTRAGYILLKGAHYYDSGGEMPLCWMPGYPEQFTNSIGMTFIQIHAGQFKMGSPLNELGRSSNEIQHDITLTKAYYMQSTEVTQGQWKSVMGSNPSHFSDCGDDCPVENISWNDTQEFIQELNKKEKTNMYRLPTEAEWEYAARAGSTTPIYNGNITKIDCKLDANLDQIGWYCGNADTKTYPIAQKLPNAWGLYDMYGNVWEWCQDWYADYMTDALTNPTGPETGSFRVARGGFWGSQARFCRSAYRNWMSPDDRLSHYGFRLVSSQVIHVTQQ